MPQGVISLHPKSYILLTTVANQSSMRFCGRIGNMLRYGLFIDCIVSMGAAIVKPTSGITTFCTAPTLPGSPTTCDSSLTKFRRRFASDSIQSARGARRLGRVRAT
jgi:hypothetical protein